MTKLHKVAFCGIAAVVLLFGLGAWAVHTLLWGDHLKHMAHDHVLKTWHRELAVDSLSLSFTPMPQFHATGVSLSNADWAHDKEFLHAKELTATIEILPLLIGKIVIDRLAIDGYVLHLQLAQNGQKNWDLHASPAAPLPPPPSSQPMLGDVPLYALAAHNGTISFRGERDEEMSWQVANAQFATGSRWRDVSLDVLASRDGHRVSIQSNLDDMSRIGMRDATSNGSVQIQAGSASLALSGELPLDPTLHRYQLKAAIDAETLDDVFGLMGVVRRSPAAFKANFTLQAANDLIDAKDIQLQIGRLHLTGAVQVNQRDKIPVFDARLIADHLDWVQARLDIGMPPLPPKPPGELFYDIPLPWAQLAATAGVQGTVHTVLHSLKLRSGLELTGVTGDMKFAGGELSIPAFKANLLGGSAYGSAVLNGSRQSARVDLHLKDTLLGLWLLETHKRVAVVGGRMQVHAAFDAQGRTMKQLAASITGPIIISIGSATVDSKKLSDAETLLNGLTPFLSAKDANQFELSCVGARLPFEHGIARGENIVGMRSEANQILGSGAVNLREQSYDLHGRVRARAGVTLGVTTFARKLKVDGKITAPHVGLDKAGAPGAIARIAAAVMTAGVSIIGTTLWDSMQSPPNPCEIALAPTTPSTQK